MKIAFFVLGVIFFVLAGLNVQVNFGGQTPAIRFEYLGVAAWGLALWVV